MPTKPPLKVNVSESTFAGVSWRAIAIVVVAIVVALGLVIAWTAPFLARLAVGLTLVGLALTYAFGTVEGRSVEHWLLDLALFRARTRHWIHRAQRGRDDGAVAAQRPAKAADAAAPGRVWPRRPRGGLVDLVSLSRPEPARPSAGRAAPPTALIGLLLNVFAFGVVLLMALYLAGDGGVRLRALFAGLLA